MTQKIIISKLAKFSWQFYVVFFVALRRFGPLTPATSCQDAVFFSGVVYTLSVACQANFYILLYVQGRDEFSSGGRAAREEQLNPSNTVVQYLLKVFVLMLSFF